MSHPVTAVSTFFSSGLGRILALIGLIIVIILLVVKQMVFLPDGLLFGLAFLAILL